MNFAAGITFFNPDANCVNKIREYANVFDIVLVYDNSLETIIEMIELPKNVQYYFNGNNDGLCVAYNFILKECYNKDIDILCTLDQDSEISTKDIISMKSTCQIKNNDIAIVSPTIIYNHEGERILQENAYELKEVNWVICSGSFIDLNLLLQHDIKYDEYYFLDRFDQDLCTQLRKSGLKIMINSNAYLFQELGYMYKGYSNHNKIRHYFIFRNRFYYNRKYYSFFLRYIRNILQTIKQCKDIIFYEDHKCDKITSMFYAISDYLQGKKRY